MNLSRRENSRVTQFWKIGPMTSVEQHPGTWESGHSAGFSSEASTAPIASDTLAATVVIVMNRILVRSSGIKESSSES